MWKVNRQRDRWMDVWQAIRNANWAFRSGELKAFSSGELKQINNGRGSQHYNSWYNSNQCALYWTDEHIIKIIYSDQYLRVEKNIFNEIMHFHYMTYMATKTTALEVMKCLCSHCCIPSVSNLCPWVEEKILKEIPMYINFTLLPQTYLPMWGQKIKKNFVSLHYTNLQ